MKVEMNSLIHDASCEKLWFELIPKAVDEKDAGGWFFRLQKGAKKPDHTIKGKLSEK